MKIKITPLSLSVIIKGKDHTHYYYLVFTRNHHNIRGNTDHLVLRSFAICCDDMETQLIGIVRDRTSQNLLPDPAIVCDHIKRILYFPSSQRLRLLSTVIS